MDDKTQATPAAESAVYRLKTPAGDVIVKEAGPVAHPQYLFEAYAYQQMERLGAKVPHVISATDQALIMTAVSGAEVKDSLTLYTDKTLFDAVAADLAKAHNIHLKGFGSAIRDEQGEFKGQNETWQEHLAALTPTIMALKPVGILSSRDVVLIQNYWTDTLPRIQLAEGSLVHGDFSLKAIFAFGEKYTGIVGFGHAMIGDPLMDLACYQFKEMAQPYGQETFDLLVQGYIAATKAGETWDPNNAAIMCFYMVYWGILELQRSSGEQEQALALDRLRALAAVIAKYTNASIGYRLDGLPT